MILFQSRAAAARVSLSLSLEIHFKLIVFEEEESVESTFHTVSCLGFILVFGSYKRK